MKLLLLEVYRRRAAVRPSPIPLCVRSRKKIRLPGGVEV